MVQHQFAAAPTGRFRITSFISALALAACSHQSDVSPAAPQAPGSAAPPANVIVEPPPAQAPQAAATPEAAPAPKMEPPVVVKDGLMAPESALYDAEQDAYLVSNVNGKPVDADGNGFISKVGTDGKLVELKWIDGTKKDSTLNAPKGLGISGNLLYVADLTFVRLFDRKTGAPKGKLAVPGSTFLNDVAVASDGTIYVSDSGIKLGKDGFEPTGTDAVWEIKSGKVKKIFTDKEATHPNGLLADDAGGVWVVTFGSGELYHVTKDGKKEQAQKLPSGALDGIVRLSDGTLLISSWGASAVFRGAPGGTFEPIIPDVKSPADIGYDTKRDVVLIPQMQADALVLQKLPGGPPAPAAKDAPPAPVAPPTAAPAPAPAASSKPAPSPRPAAPGTMSASVATSKPTPSQTPVPAAAPAAAAVAPAAKPAAMATKAEAPTPTAAVKK